MAVIENKVTEIGDVLIIKTDVPIIGIVTLLSFVDVTKGEVGNKYFSKTFRYSVDGINFSPYILLTDANIQGIEINSTDTLVLEYVYQRSGLEDSGSLEFDSVTLEGQFVDIICGEAYDRSMFSDCFNCNNLCSLNWSINVLEKLYKKGILPNYIERGFGDSNAEDRDFIDFWRSVTHFFALFVCLARQFSTFYTNEELLKSYLDQRNLFFCTNSDYQSLYYLMQNYYDEIRQRGTIQIIKEKNTTDFIGTTDCDDSSVSTSLSQSSSTTDSKYINGELLRLICYDITDEFMFNVCKAEKIGWNIGNSSPLYSGMSNQNGVNKAYEDSQDVEDLSLYPLINSSNCSILNDVDKNVLFINAVQNGQVAGIGHLDFSKAIKVDPQLDYEITFAVKQAYDVSQSASLSQSVSQSFGNNGNLTFGCLAFNSYGGVVNLTNIITGADDDYFLEKINLPREDKYFYLRGMIFNYNKYKEFSPLEPYTKGEIVSLSGTYYRCIKSIVTSLEPDVTPLNWVLIPIDELNFILKNSLNIGNNLKFKDTVNYIIPYIVLDNENSVGGELSIWDIKVKPISTPYSHGFIQTPNFIHIWLKNKNGQYSEEDIKQIMRKYLLPYNTTFKNIYLLPSKAEEDIANLGDFNSDFNDDFNI